MTIPVQCTCGKALNAPDSAAGKKGKCPACGKTLLIPNAVQTTPSDLVEWVCNHRFQGRRYRRSLPPEKRLWHGNPVRRWTKELLRGNSDAALRLAEVVDGAVATKIFTRCRDDNSGHGLKLADSILSVSSDEHAKLHAVTFCAGQIEDFSAAYALRNALEDESHRVRMEAMKALISTPDRTCDIFALELYSRDADQRNAAAHVLFTFGPYAVPHLSSSIKAKVHKSDDEGRHLAVATLARIDLPTAVSTLKELAFSHQIDRLFVGWAIKALESMAGEKAALSCLIEIVQCETVNDWVRETAAKAISTHSPTISQKFTEEQTRRKLEQGRRERQREQEAKERLETENADLMAKLGSLTTTEIVRELERVSNATAGGTTDSQKHRIHLLGKELHKRGGLEEMRRAYHLMWGGSGRGSRVIEIHWDGVGRWRM